MAKRLSCKDAPDLARSVPATYSAASGSSCEQPLTDAPSRLNARSTMDVPVRYVSSHVAQGWNW